jgi:hypothetical protein
VAVVATARKIAILAWHLLTKDENYAWARPALLNAKLRKVELLAGQPQKGADEVVHTPTTIALSVNGSAPGSNKPGRPTPASSRAGRPSLPRRMGAANGTRRS